MAIRSDGFSRSAMGLAGRSATEKLGAGDSSATESDYGRVLLKKYGPE